jgi:hypothetical protein
MVLGGRQHVHNPRTCALLAKLHLQYRPINWFARNLVCEHVELPMRDLEVGRRVFVL